jgi:AcrR family transcriptional regulator
MNEQPGRPLRADAQRNRARILEVAAEAFAAEGLSVPVHEIARRTGVGTGTVSRHFPTKESLIEAVLVDRMQQLALQAAELAATEDPGTAFRAFFSTVAHVGVTHRGLAESLIGAGYPLMAEADRAGLNPKISLEALLTAAQQAGAIRLDIAFPQVKALLDACCLVGDESVLPPMIDVICTGLRP